VTRTCGDSYSHTYETAPNGGGWSIKLAPGINDVDDPEKPIMQWEYTFLNDGEIWYDLSGVDGSPYGDDWEISNDNPTCAVEQKQYLHPTDDTKMQGSCQDSTSIKVTLCPNGGSGGNSSDSTPPPPDYSAGDSSSTTSTTSSTVDPAAYTPEVEAAGETIVETAAQTTAVAQETQWGGRGGSHRGNWGPPQKRATDAAPTTLATRVATEVPSAQVTAVKRHEHRARHPRQRLE